MVSSTSASKPRYCQVLVPVRKGWYVRRTFWTVGLPGFRIVVVTMRLFRPVVVETTSSDKPAGSLKVQEESVGLKTASCVRTCDSRCSVIRRVLVLVVEASGFSIVQVTNGPAPPETI